jgi:hypothetical protein
MRPGMGQELKSTEQYWADGEMVLIAAEPGRLKME